MLEQYKTLGAVMALREFTIDQVVQLANVNRRSAHTVLNRHRDSIERIGLQRTGRRGGQLARYRLKPEAVEPIRAILRNVEEAAQQPEAEVSTELADQPPIELAGAEGILLDRLPAESDPASRMLLLDSARDLFIAGWRDAQQSAVGHAHLNAVRLLLDLVDAELQREGDPDARHAWQRLNSFAQSLDIPNDARLAQAVRARFAKSPLAPKVEKTRDRPGFAVGVRSKHASADEDRRKVAAQIEVVALRG